MQTFRVCFVVLFCDMASPGQLLTGPKKVPDRSVQGRHIHIMCEAANRRALSRGIQGFKIRVAKAVNKVEAYHDAQLLDYETELIA